MSALRLFTLPTHAVIELVAGMTLMLAPFVLAFGTAGTILAFGGGVVLVGLALAGVEDLTISTHVAIDQALISAFLIAAVALALAGDAAAGSVFLAAGLAQLTLAATTRYTRPPR